MRNSDSGRFRYLRWHLLAVYSERLRIMTAHTQIFCVPPTLVLTCALPHIDKPF